MDANAYAYADKDQLDVSTLSQYYTSKGLNSCYGPRPDRIANVTTCHARTFLQPQLNKVRRLSYNMCI